MQKDSPNINAAHAMATRQESQRRRQTMTIRRSSDSDESAVGGDGIGPGSYLEGGGAQSRADSLNESIPTLSAARCYLLRILLHMHHHHTEIRTVPLLECTRETLVRGGKGCSNVLTYLFLFIGLMAWVWGEELPVQTAAQPLDALRPGDVLQMDVYNNPDLSALIRIPATGPAHFPLIGAVDHVKGMTIDALSNRLKKLYEEKYLRNAMVLLTVKEYGMRRVYVMGSVAHPSAIDLDPGVSSSAIRALSSAGGLLDEAARQGIMVIRENEHGAVSVFPVAVADNGTANKDIPLMPNDLIVVPRLDRVYITGQVMKPGAINIPSQETLTVSKAISLAGGFDKYAREGEVKLLQAGSPVRTVDVEALLSGHRELEDPVLHPGDTVYVPQRRF
jgi:polysaccharide export outer membrane protein